MCHSWPRRVYLAKFLGVEASPSNEYGEGRRWPFEVVSGPQKGSKTSRVTGQSPSLKNGCGKIVTGLTGKPLTPGDDIDVDLFIGKIYLIVVANTEGGGTRIDSVSPPPVG
jgi:hypothetical protein